MIKKNKRMLTMLISLALATGISGQAFASDEIRQGVTSYVNETYVKMEAKEKDKFIEELYNERINAMQKLNEDNTKQESSDNNEINEAYDRINQEEEYIVDLINSCGETTTLSNWQFNLNYLQKNYNSIKKMKDINLNYVDSYIEAYKIVTLNEAMPDKKVSYKLARGTSYDYNAAVNYATTHYKNYNTNYPDWNSYGGDCANFISQCLHDGGKAMKGSAGSSSAANFSNWFSYGNKADTSKVSSTWRGADAFRNYWQTNATSYKKFTSVNNDSWNYGNMGDAVSLLNSNGRAYHTMIIVGSNKPDFTLAAHTSETKTASLKDKASSDGFIIYNMR